MLRPNGCGIERLRKKQAIETCQVRVVKMSESEPSMKHRNKQIVTKTSVCYRRWDKHSGYLFTGYAVHGVQMA